MLSINFLIGTWNVVPQVFLLLSPYFFNVNTTFTSAKQYALSVHLMFELCLSQVFSSFEFKIARAKILLETFSELYANKGDFILELFFGFQGCCFGFYPSSMYFVVKHVNTRLPNLWRLFFKRSIYQASVIISEIEIYNSAGNPFKFW